MYENAGKTSVMGTDYLIVDTKNLTVSNKDEQDNDGRSVVSDWKNSEGKIEKYILTDTQFDAIDETGYHVNQSKIQWGLPIGYIVIPIKESDSFSIVKFKNKTLEFDANSTVKFENDFAASKIKTTNTFGYGMNVHAAKAKSGSGIEVTWDKPNNSTDLQPTIYRMPYNKDKNYDYGEVWKKVKPLSDKHTSFIDDTIPNEDAHLAFVYAVEYQASTTSNLVKSYRKELSNKKDSFSSYPINIEKEAANKGYMSAIKGFFASNVEDAEIGDIDYFQERLQWDAKWNFEDRSLSPKSFQVCIKNKNIEETKDWFVIADVDINDDGTFKITKRQLDDKYDIKVTPLSSNDGLKISPATFIKEGITKSDLPSMETNGLLKVLRDTKHYYSLNITSDLYDSNNKKIYDRQAANESVYTFRQITDKELFKCVSLILADAIYIAGIPKADTGQLQETTSYSHFTHGNKGTFTITHTGMWSLFHGTRDDTTWGLGFQDYVHKFLGGTPTNPNETLISDFTLYAGNSDTKKGMANNKLYYLPTLTFSVSHNSKLSSCNNLKITYTVGKEGLTPQYYLSINKNGSSELVVNIDDNDSDFINWFPYYLDNDMSATPITSYTTKAGSKNECPPLYNSPWWN